MRGLKEPSGFKTTNRNAPLFVGAFRKDIAAFQLLFAMNPKVTWIYVTGSDKVNKYGTANERDLVKETLAKRGVNVLFLERDSEPINLHSVFLQPWLRHLWEPAS